MLGGNGRGRPRFPARRGRPACYSRAMSRRERRASGVDRIGALLEAGDHRAARAAANAVLADPSSAPEARAAAEEALASLAPERGALLAGGIGLVAAVALSAFVLLRG